MNKLNIDNNLTINSAIFSRNTGEILLLFCQIQMTKAINTHIRRTYPFGALFFYEKLFSQFKIDFSVTKC